MSRTINIAIILTLFWLLLSGHYVPLFFFFAFVSIALVVWLSVRMDKVDEERDSIMLSPSLIKYWLWLAWEAVRSNADMVKRVWSPSLPISPAIGSVKTSQKTRMGRVILANSITLTPGTVTLELDEEKQELKVHAIDRALIEDLQSGDMDQRVSKAEGQ